jgi:hypothetical protein
MLHPSNRPWFHRHNNIRLGVQSTEHISTHFSTSYCYFLPPDKSSYGTRNERLKPLLQGLKRVTDWVQDYVRVLWTPSQHLTPDEAITHSAKYQTCCYVRSPVVFLFLTIQTILRWWRTWRSLLCGRCWHMVVRNVRIINKVSHWQLHKTRFHHNEPAKLISYLKALIVRAQYYWVFAHRPEF